MKNNSIQKKYIFALLLVFILLFATSTSAFYSWDDPLDLQGGLPDDSGALGDIFVPDEVLAPADSWEQAWQIAAAYGQELKSYAYGVAVLGVPDAEQAVAHSVAMAAASQSPLAFGVRLPELSLNNIYQLYDDIVEVYPLDSEYSTARAYIPGQEYDINSAAAYGEAQWHHDFMDSELAWELTTGEGVVIAVIDTGIDIDHPKFAGRILPNSYNSVINLKGLDYVRDDHGRSHGTHVAGIAAAAMEGDPSVCGVAPKASILAIKTNDPASGVVNSESWVRGLNYAAENGAHIVNMSIGRPYTSGANSIEQNAIANAVAQGVTIVCSAGNIAAGHASYPAAYPETIAVAALGANGFYAPYSNYGPEIDVAAPGSAIYSTVAGGYSNLSGTSMASPNVAGVAALIKSRHPEYSPEQIRDVMHRTARKVTQAEKDERYGYGQLNAYTAVQGDFTYYAVIYDFNDGVHAPISLKQIGGARLFKPDYPIREGFVFAGWFTAKDGGDEFDFSTRINADITIYAQWGVALPGMFASEFPDPYFCNEVLKLVSQAGDNKNPMSLITDADFEIFRNRESLSVAGKGIRSLKGIEHFEILKELNCTNNRLTEIDLSRNTNLTILECFGNSFTELDISENGALRELYCQENSLSSLDVSKNWDLRFFYCDSNMIETLDVSENEYLIHFSCNYNRLKELDVSNNLFITLLSVVDNMLTGIDVSNNSWLRYFYCDFNSLTELDISANTRLVFLSCDYNKLPELNLSNNPNLKAMTCTGNMLANLDISKCPELGILGCQYNYIKSIDDVIGWRLNYYLVPDRTFLFSPQFVGKPPVGLEVTPFFTDPNFLAAVREITAIPEGPIYDYNVHFIMDLNLASKNIADLSGIEYFVNLTRLECQDNQLKTLDISKNMALSYLNCSYNNMETTADVKGWEELGLRQNISFIFSPQNGQHLVETPRITKQPESITVGKDGVATLAVEAEVTYGILTYQWYEQSGIPFVPITGATDSSYNVPTNIAGIKRYRCTITNTDETAAVYKTAVTSTNGATVTVTNESPVSFNVTGLVKSYNPKNPTTLLLFKGEEAQAAYATTIPGVNGSGQQVQDFTFPDVEPGTYKLVITKDVHTRFTVKNVVVDNKDLDLTLDDRPEVQLITLRCGDINSDGLINDADLTILWRAGNYNNRAARAENPLADLNNDGLINDADLTILWMAYNYNRGEIVIDW